jgi:Ca2+-binding RTX toxin-like protein
MAVETCDGRAATITGAGTINGTAGMDVIVGSGGDDTIDGLGGMDIICAGDGFDFVTGGPGADRLFGEQDKDWIVGDTFGGPDVIGNTGADYIDAGPNGDSPAGQIVVGDNWAPTGTASSTGSGDTIKVPEGATDVVGDNKGKSASGGGNDNITIGARISPPESFLRRVFGGNEAVAPAGAASGGGSDTITGSPLTDYLVGDNTGSSVDGGGNDIINGGEGGDVLRGDNFLGNTIGPNGGKDILDGQDGDDSLSGGPAFDNCNGGDGTDIEDGTCEQVAGIP